MQDADDQNIFGRDFENDPISGPEDGGVANFSVRDRIFDAGIETRVDLELFQDFGLLGRQAKTRAVALVFEVNDGAVDLIFHVVQEPQRHGLAPALSFRIVSRNRATTASPSTAWSSPRS